MILLLLLIIRFRLHVFIALLVTGLIVGMGAGMAPHAIVQSISIGMGDTLANIALIVGLGTIFGKMLEVSGGALSLADSLLKKFGTEKSRTVLAFTGYLVGIPVFFNAGLVILTPAVYGLARKSGKPLMYFALPLLAGLVATHTFVPPTPGPIGAAGLLGADLGWVMLFGVIAAVPATIVGGVLYGKWVSRYISSQMPETATSDPPPFELKSKQSHQTPSAAMVAILILLPIFLILLGSLSTRLSPTGRMASVLQFVGHPFMALLVCTLASLYFLGSRLGFTAKQLQTIANEALAPAGMIILVIGAGGVFKQILIDSQIGEMLAHVMTASSAGPLLLSFSLAAALRLLQGSGTVAMVSAAGLVAAIIPANETDPRLLALMVIALASGATISSHVNDSGFWMVNRYFGLSVPDTLRSWTVSTTLTGVVGLATTLLLSIFI